MKGNFKIKIPEELVLTLPDENGNNINSKLNIQLREYGISIAMRGWDRWYDNGYMYVNAKTLTLDEFLLIITTGCEVVGFLPLLKISGDVINEPITIGLPNREIVDIDKDGGVTTTYHTWKTSRTVSYPLGENINGYYYIPAINSFTGDSYTDKELLMIYNEGIVQLVETCEIN